MRQIVVVAQGARASSIADALRAAGFEVHVTSGGSGLADARHDEADLVVLDPDSAGTHGVAMVERQGEERPALPVVVLAAGTDDHEVVSRVREHLRRTDPSPGGGEDLSTGALRLDARARRAWVGEREVALSPREFALAKTLLRHRGQVLTREQLLEHVWGHENGLRSNVVDVYVGYLRRKLGSDAVVTVRGIGYRAG
ncbi:response regulator transcription factor [Aeromicrobium senzhongii]|uniref:Response regulator transcription factor n=1 Tax=Aeromicrobium senzhongii TaxID=2663859 RepID=A0ABX6SQM4_9ACTN|nr:response regulator transcription factor [Aeromicrobium senzhongii]MTB86809.1 DNA-binding response regulator [Aeromicrobium senzhongii]QNL93351.1 response regulator transcription factor [Aeromicrobium senzhongii]